MIGADILLEALGKEGVDVIFGYPGGVLLGFYDRLYDFNIKHVLPRHEQGAAHAAEGYAKSTGKVGVCMGTSGPGATNLVTGIADAYMDSVPLVVLTGQVSLDMIGGDAFQEADIIGITSPIVKHSYLVKNVNELAKTVKEAFYLASTGRPGPVLIDLPKDVLAAKANFRGKFEYPTKVDIPGYCPNYEGHTVQIKKLLHALESAKKPLLMVGGGVISGDASKALLKFVDHTGIPVITTFMGHGAFPSAHPMYIGWAGMHGNYASNEATLHADYIFAVGTRFSDRTTGVVKEFAPKAQIAQVDIDPTSIGKNIPVNLPIVGDAKTVLEQLLRYIKEFKKDKNASAREEWVSTLKKWTVEKPFRYTMSNQVIKPQYVIEEISKLTKGEAILTTDVGQHQMWTGQFYKFQHPHSFISSCGLGTMGFGLPAGIGAKVGNPDKEVFVIAGDGSILMNIQELTTAVQYRLGIKVAILNNKFLGMVRQWQELFFNKRYSYTCLESQPDFVELAKAFGCVGLRAEKPGDVKDVLAQAMLVNDRPVVMDFVCAKEENVFPMVPAGKNLGQMIFE